MGRKYGNRSNQRPDYRVAEPSRRATRSPLFLADCESAWNQNVRQQVGQLLERSGGKSGEHIRKVVEGIDAVPLATGGHADEHRHPGSPLAALHISE
jgi:hypothetical protein